jgi:hypothetical protein
MGSLSNAAGEIMSVPPSANSDDNRFSAQPLPPADAGAISQGSPPASGKPDAEELYNYVAACLQHGHSRAEICPRVMSYGYSEADADRFVEQVERDQRQAANPPPPEGYGGNSGATNMVMGALVGLVGIVITVATYSAASEGGGRYVVAYGAIIWGAIQFFRGLSQSSQSGS